MKIPNSNLDLTASAWVLVQQDELKQGDPLQNQDVSAQDLNESELYHDVACLASWLDLQIA